jgi:hypothetical protein
MHARMVPAALAIVLCASIASLLLASSSSAQTSVPDVTGHGSCYQTPNNEPGDVAVMLGGMDSFLHDRAARILSAAAHWNPIFARPAVSVRRTRTAVLRTRVGR